ncbi:hypothetical protein J437_LFUL011027 [Ladona fulva]|uniref:Uncharacterized protein n=1 Tax=Ladona fulva TaxID=123851 RepID=A0A8K0KIH8_LADFU|nr:hypothetical protein J437_LFUL011027 [Ladona fulva]
MASLIWRKKRWRDFYEALLLLCFTSLTLGQDYRDRTGERDYSRNGVYNPDGSYGSQSGHPAYGPQWPGQQWQQDWESRRRSGGWNGDQDDRYKYTVTSSTESPLRGVMAGWRPDLQGRQRPDWQSLDRDIQVSTSYGQVQGFKVYLYDNPDPDSGFRPGQSPVDRVQGTASVFLGIPYAVPPLREGRFKENYLIFEFSEETENDRNVHTDSRFRFRE